jgi:hypothetical protein
MKTSAAFKIVTKAWKTNDVTFSARDGRAIFGYKELENRRFHLSFSFNERYDGLGVLFNCSFVPNELGNAIDSISEETHDVFPFKERKWQFYQVSECELETLTELVAREAESWVNISNFSEYMQWLVSTLDKPGAHQLWHVSGLAVAGNIGQLQTYLSNIESENRGGLFPYITKDVLLKAIQYAKEST